MPRIKSSILRMSILGCLSIAGLAFNSAASADCTGIQNTCFGEGALQSSTTGQDNSAFGFGALNDNSGGENTATGSFALFLNSSGSQNTANGAEALYFNETGSFNTAFGVRALHWNATGSNNTAVGRVALGQNTFGVRNVGLGYLAGLKITGNDNIVIGGGNQGQATDNGVIRIGTKASQTRTFIAGIKGVQTGSTNASTVFVDGNGQLGTIKSSARYKEDIRPMGSVSERLMSLRPVTFRYKDADEDGSKPIQFGLIAEEVGESFPELVVSGEDGQPETVRYDLVATLLLNEFQKSQGVIQRQASRIEALESQLEEIAALKREYAAMAAAIERLNEARIVAVTH